MGGEKLMGRPRRSVGAGSPPRGRGKVYLKLRPVFSGRITPAWAGKRFNFWRSKCETRDHPRVGGEKRIFCIILTASDGSPPRGRGKVYLKLRPVFSGRITPAWAGKREWKQAHCCRGWDHPRVGGEKTLFCFLFLAGGGSPPRGRGKA